jgi:hypothetical protein
VHDLGGNLTAISVDYPGESPKRRDCLIRIGRWLPNGSFTFFGRVKTTGYYQAYLAFCQLAKQGNQGICDYSIIS